MKTLRAFRRLLFHALACLLLCAAAGHLSVARAECDRPSEWLTKTNNLTWESFKAPGLSGDRAQCYRLPDGDIISLRREPKKVAADQIEFVLETSLNVTWWKGLKLAKVGCYVYDQPCMVHSTETADDKHTSQSIIVRAQDPDVPHGYLLVFYKAKALGVHTEMYRLNVGDTRKLRGYRLTFVWEKDG